MTRITCADGTVYDIDTWEGASDILRHLGCACMPDDTLRSSSDGCITPPGWMPTLDDKRWTDVDGPKRTIVCTGCNTQITIRLDGIIETGGSTS